MTSIKNNKNQTLVEEHPIVLGRGGDGKLVEAKLGDLNSTLIGGLSGSGKSTLLQHIVDQSCDQAQVFIIDLKRVGFLDFKDRENCHVITDINKCPKLFQKLTQELEGRYQEMEKNKTDVCNRGRILILCDEAGELLPFIDTNTYDQIRRILSLGRACKMTIVMATQSPSRRLLSGAIIDLFQSRIGLRCNSVYASKVVLDQSGCEKLPNFSALYMNPQGFKVQLQILPPTGQESEDEQLSHDTIDWDDD